MSETPTERLLALLRREVGAEDVRLVDADAAPLADAGVTLECALPDGRRVRATLAAPPDDRAALERKMALLVETFRETLAVERPSARPPSASTALDLELEALVQRTGAVDAVVIDAHSPIVWGDADEELSLRPSYDTDVIPFPSRTLRSIPPAGEAAEVLELPRAPSDRVPGAGAGHPLSSRAMSEVRALPETASLHRGGVLRHTVRGDDFGYVARSFGTIYVLLVVFDAPYDEWTTERAIANALPRIERLVLALPPLDPEPLGRAGAMRKRGR